MVRVQYDPSIISYEDLLRIFWEIHDPTTINHQGPDVGTQYRSIILYETLEQKEIAEKLKRELENKATFEKPIVTEIEPFTFFVRAEEYHQKYVMKSDGGVCRI